MFGETVDVVVGETPNIKTFKLHKGVVSFYSGYFEGALRGGFAKAIQGKVELPTEEVDVFEWFVQWIYTRRIEEPRAGEGFGTVCKLWALADRREVPLLMNQCIDALRDQVAEQWLVPTDQLGFIYEHTFPYAGLRRLAVDLTTKAGGPSLLQSSMTFPNEVLRDFLQVTWALDYSKRMNKEDVAKLDTCTYHRHEDGVKCTKKT